MYSSKENTVRGRVYFGNVQAELQGLRRYRHQLSSTCTATGPAGYWSRTEPHSDIRASRGRPNSSYHYGATGHPRCKLEPHKNSWYAAVTRKARIALRASGIHCFSCRPIPHSTSTRCWACRRLKAFTTGSLPQLASSLMSTSLKCKHPRPCNQDHLANILEPHRSYQF